MRLLLAALLLFGGLSASAQSNLPPCPADPAAYRHNCFATYAWPSGERYAGEYRDGKRHGQGTWTQSDGSKYVGEYRDGKFHGQGTLTFPNGEKYVSEFRDMQANGHGTHTLSSGQKYVGN